VHELRLVMSFASLMQPADFFRAVYANPNDEGPKRVLADMLMEVGDPRGELIALQMLRRRSRKAELKLARLFDRHLTQFLGPLAASVSPRGQVWESGFLVECNISFDGTLVDEPSLSTLRTVHLLNREPEMPLELLGPHCLAVREVNGVPTHAVVLLFAHERSLPFLSVRVDGPGNAEAWSATELESVRVARGLPHLRHLSLTIWRFGVDELEWLWTAPVFGRLRSIELGLNRVAIDVGALRDRLVRLDEGPDALILHGRQLELKLKSTDTWRVMHLTIHTPRVEPVMHDAELMLQSLPTNGLTRLGVSSDFPVPHEALARLKALVKRFPRLAPMAWPSSR
jgi:uncharacterized protein (TIGR02996 family)